MTVGLVELMILKCIDGTGDEWYIVPPEEVPEWVKDPDTVDFLVEGHTAQAPGETDMYLALKAGHYVNMPTMGGRIKLIDSGIDTSGINIGKLRNDSH